MLELNLIPGQLSLAQLRAIYQQPVTLSLDDSATAQIEASVACVEQILAENRTAYGINTGFGLLASTRIASEDLENLQRSLVLSHAAGVGEPISDALVRLVMVLKVNSLSHGFSGIRRQVIDALIALINAEVYPHIPLKGSVGASGDLAPLAHMSLVLLGEGKARYKGEWLDAVTALKQAGLEPLTLAAKEGLALLNGTQVSTAYALRGLFEGEGLHAQRVGARKQPVGAAAQHAVKAAIAQQQGAFVFLHGGALEHLQHLFFLFLLRCRHSSHIGLPLQRWRGARGHSLGRAVRRGGCPHPQQEGRAAARLAAGAGCAGCWHKPPPADGVNPLRLRRNLGVSPRVRRVVFRPVLPVMVFRPWAGIEPATDLLRGCSTNELPKVASRESNPGSPLARRHRSLANTQHLRCAACKESTES